MNDEPAVPEPDKGRILAGLKFALAFELVGLKQQTLGNGQRQSAGRHKAGEPLAVAALLEDYLVSGLTQAIRFAAGQGDPGFSP